MARFYFEWLEDDGVMFRRYRRSGPFEASLVLRDRDDPKLRVIHPVQFSSLKKAQEVPLDVVLRMAIESVNELMEFYYDAKVSIRKPYFYPQS